MGQQLYVGQQLGHYRLVRLLGQGGFAEVYLGEHIHLNTLAAVKVLHTRLADEDIQEFRHSLLYRHPLVTIFMGQDCTLAYRHLFLQHPYNHQRPTHRLT